MHLCHSAGHSYFLRYQKDTAYLEYYNYLVTQK